MANDETRTHIAVGRRRAPGCSDDHQKGMWSEFAACARTDWSSLPWSEDASKSAADRMRWVWVNICPPRIGFERDVAADVAADLLPVVPVDQNMKTAMSLCLQIRTTRSW